jgi:hypothetical protein
VSLLNISFLFGTSFLSVCKCFYRSHFSVKRTGILSRGEIFIRNRQRDIIQDKLKENIRRRLEINCSIGLRLTACPSCRLGSANCMGFKDVHPVYGKSSKQHCDMGYFSFVCRRFERIYFCCLLSVSMSEFLMYI